MPREFRVTLWGENDKALCLPYEIVWHYDRLATGHPAGAPVEFLDDEAFRRGGARMRKAGVESALEVAAHLGADCPPPMFPRSARRAVVVRIEFKDRAAEPRYLYRAEYELRRLPWQPVTCAIPEGEGRAISKLGDLSDVEMQPYACEVCPDPWRPGDWYFRHTEELPFEQSSDDWARMSAGLARHRLPTGGIHILAPQKDWGCAVKVMRSEAKPPKRPAAKKGRRS